MTIIATDEKGNTFEKRVKLRLNKQRTIFSLGFPYEWELEMLRGNPPTNDKFYIDACGRNHKNSPVTVSYKEAMEIADKLQEKE